MRMTPNTWIISDTHWGHMNIVKYCNRPRNHNTLMRDNWVKLVKPTDQILHLGDLCIWFGHQQRYWETVAKRMPGRKYLMIGNHDPRSDEWYERMGYTVVDPFVWKGILFTHAPAMPGDYIGSPWHTNIHGHIHTNGHSSDALLFDRKYVNVSVEVMKYKPHKLGDILSNSLGNVTLT